VPLKALIYAAGGAFFCPPKELSSSVSFIGQHERRAHCIDAG
jgi:hypothetical protein